MSATGPTPPRPAAADPRPFTGPLFLVGMPRSGTKLLRELLCAHPQIGVPQAETELLPDWALRWPSFGDLSQPAAWDRFTAAVAGSAYFTYLREERGLPLDAAAWRARCPDLSLQGVFEGLCRLHGGAPEGGVWGDKSPGYVAHLPLLWALWPEARVVHIVRDCRDYALSMQKAWGKDPERAAWRWAERVAEAEAAGARQPGRYLRVRYEDLLADPEPILRQISDLVGLSFDSAMLVPRSAPENLGSAAGAAQIQRDNGGRWRFEMEPALQARIEAVAGAQLVACGYPVGGQPGATRPSRLRRRALQLKDGAALLRFEARARGPVEALRFRWRLFRESGAWEG
jgi:hypothetical protein